MSIVPFECIVDYYLNGAMRGAEQAGHVSLHALGTTPCSTAKYGRYSLGTSRGCPPVGTRRSRRALGCAGDWESQRSEGIVAFCTTTVDL